MNVFFDTSALVKRYVEEPGSDRVQRLCAGAERLYLSVLCLPEMISTLNRLVRERKIAQADYAGLKARILEDLEDIDVVDLTAGVVARAVRLLEENPLRALDALQLGARWKLPRISSRRPTSGRSRPAARLASPWRMREREDLVGLRRLSGGVRRRALDGFGSRSAGCAGAIKG